MTIECDEIILTTLEAPKPPGEEPSEDPGGGDITAYCCLDGVNIGFRAGV